MKNGPARERGFHRSKSNKEHVTYSYPAWVSSGVIPQQIQKELETARHMASRGFTAAAIAERFAPKEIAA